MTPTVDTLSRVSKLLVDREEITPEEALSRRQKHAITLVAGPEIASSPTLRAALLTAANVASRCFPGGVRVVMPGIEADAIAGPWDSWGGLSGHLINCMLGADRGANEIEWTVAFGSVRGMRADLCATFDRWSAAVCPDPSQRLPEREGCVLSGVVAGALAVSEIFFRAMGLNPEASRRSVGLSLWNPLLRWDDRAAAGPVVEYLPSEFWLLGLGHLGQAFAWCLALLPFEDRAGVNLLLQDHDHVTAANLETGLWCDPRSAGAFKASMMAGKLRRIGFRPRVVERRFDESTRVMHGEPRLGLCGFDGQGPRHLLGNADFGHVIECGLGGGLENFDAMLLHSLRRGRNCAELWPASKPSEGTAAETLAASNRFYREFGNRHKCGHVELAGRAIAVPFVGAVAGALVLAESIRMLTEGIGFDQLDVRLATADRAAGVELSPGYLGNQAPRLAFIRAKHA